MSASLLIFAAALVVSLALTPLARRLSLRWGIVKSPGGRRKHTGAMPLLGGLPLMGAYLVGIGVAFYLLPPAADSPDAQYLRGVLLGSLVCSGVFRDTFFLELLDPA